MNVHCGFFMLLGIHYSSVQFITAFLHSNEKHTISTTTLQTILGRRQTIHFSKPEKIRHEVRGICLFHWQRGDFPLILPHFKNIYL